MSSPYASEPKPSPFWTGTGNNKKMATSYESNSIPIVYPMNNYPLNYSPTSSLGASEKYGQIIGKCAIGPLGGGKVSSRSR